MAASVINVPHRRNHRVRSGVVTAMAVGVTGLAGLGGFFALSQETAPAVLPNVDAVTTPVDHTGFEAAVRDARDDYYASLEGVPALAGAASFQAAIDAERVKRAVPLPVVPDVPEVESVFESGDAQAIRAAIAAAVAAAETAPGAP